MRQLSLHLFKIKRRWCYTPSKRTFKTERQAWKMALYLFEKFGKSLQGVYKCRCGFYHLTSQEIEIPKWVENKLDKYIRTQ